MNKLFLLILLALFSSLSSADIVKPALIEISVYTDGHYEIEVRASIEAMLTGINAQYKNTSESPDSLRYEVLRRMTSSELLKAFKPFHQPFTDNIKLKLDNQIAPLTISKITVPEPGYTKVPRISIIALTGNINRSVETISWLYPAAFADNAVRVRQIDKHNEKWHWSNWQWLRDGQWSKSFSLKEVFHKPSFISTATTYLVAGYNHILPKGLDHILFILVLFLLSTKLKPLLWQVTTFTIAHSITLSMAMLEIFTLPERIVEPLIALSIAYIGIENIYVEKIKPSRLIVVFTFGLLHGMGFARMLNDFGLPNDSFATALVSFNIGVELGQLSIIVFAYIFVSYWFKNKRWYRKIVVIPVSILISIIGLTWAYQRLAF